MHSDLVSIVIPVYNGEQYILECIQSALGQSYPFVEVLVIDDGSTDSTFAICTEVSSRDSRLRVVRNQFKGVSSARNLGLEEAYGKWITFLDADDWIAPSFVKRMIDAARNDNVDVVISTGVLRTLAEEESGSSNVLMESSNHAVTRLLYPMMLVGCWNKLYKRQALITNEIRFDSSLSMGEGLMFSIRAVMNARTIAITDALGYFYRRDNDSSVTTKLSPERMIQALETLCLVEEQIDTSDPAVRSAFNYHVWRTSHLAATVFYGFGLEDSDARFTMINESYIQNRWRTLFSAQVDLKNWCKTFSVCVAPKWTAKLIAKRKGFAGKV